MLDKGFGACLKARGVGRVLVGRVEENKLGRLWRLVGVGMKNMLGV